VTRIVDAFGVAGMGKTRLVQRLHEEATRRGVVVCPVTLHESDSPTTDSQALVRFVQLVKTLGANVFAKRPEQLRFLRLELAQATQQKESVVLNVGNLSTFVHADHAQVAEGANLGGIEMILRGYDDAVLRGEFLATASAFAAAFSDVVSERTALVTVDGFDSIAGTTYGNWVISLLAQLPNTLVVVTRSPGAPPPFAPGTPLEKRRLEPFSREEVAELLACCLRDRTIDPRLVDVVHEWSEGHVFSATLAARYLLTLKELDPAALELRLRPGALPDELAGQRAEIALEILSAPGAGDLAAAARALSVTRRFDGDLLRSLCGDEPAAERVIESLRGAGIVEPAGEGSYRVHSFLREPLEAMLTPSTRRELHGRVAAYYYDVLCQEEPELETSARAYDAWYRYEKPEWQAQLREWLYHSRGAAKDDTERERARLRFTRVFLDAFWWWGCYLPFRFCPDLIADWRRARGDDIDWVEDLELLLDAYPPGHRKHGEGRWTDVRAALVAVREACGLDVKAEALTEHDARHTHGLIDNFLAHSFRYATPSSEQQRERLHRQALEKYDEAALLFEQGEETWELAWTLFERAELHAENGDAERAREDWRQAVILALDEEDWELTANLHRLAADLRWRDGDGAGAFDAHSRAVLHAYLFQCKTASRRPDAYTVTFYWEQLERTFKRLTATEGAAREDAVARLARAFGAEPAAVDDVARALASDDPRQLAGLVFPEGPKDDELLDVRSPFTRRVDLLADELAPERDLEGVEP
jgi:hypothetical protein